MMIWFVRAMVICLFVFYGTALRSPQLQPTVPNLIAGFFTGLMMIGFSLLIGRIGRTIRAKRPDGAKRAGNVFYWIGNTVAIFCIGLALFAAFQGMSARVAVIAASFAPFYWASGWGLRRALTSN